MKKLLFVVLLFSSLFANAGQELVVPNYCFIDSLSSAEPKMCELILQLLPEYKLMKSETIKSSIERTLKNDSGDSIIIRTVIQLKNANPDFKIKGDSLITSQNINAQFLTLHKIYNLLFPKQLTAEQLNFRKMQSGPLFYDDARYWYVINKSGEEGYWVISMFDNKR